MPCVNIDVNGSSKVTCLVAFMPRVKKRAYSRCSTACSLPPMYWSTGAQYFSAFLSVGVAALGAV